MTRRQLKSNIRTQQKALAAEIHTLKASRKEDKRDGRALWMIESDIYSRRYKFRHTHIAFCMFFNHRTIEEIECTTSPRYVGYNINRVKVGIETWEDMIDETKEDVCDRAA